MSSDPRIGSISTSAKDAMAELTQLRQKRPSSSFVISKKGHFIDPGRQPDEKRPVAEILAAANGLAHPAGLWARGIEQTRKDLARYEAGLATPPTIALHQIGDPNIRALYEEHREELKRVLAAGEPWIAEDGEWSVDRSTPRTVPLLLHDSLTERPTKDICILEIPDPDWTTIPAHLKFGGWNMCPETEFHVAALRSWRDRYGADLVAMSGDTIELRVKKPVKARDEAWALAKEHLLYCNETETIALAASELLDNEWWFFWWD